MRRRLVVVSLATTVLIVVALIVPLGLLVRRQAADRARVSTERAAQSTAALVALAVTIDPAAGAMAGIEDGLDPDVLVALEDGMVLGEPLPGQGTLIATAFDRQATITALVDGGWEIALPIIGAEGVVVVDAFTTDEELTEGVLQAWVLLILLGVFLVGVAVWVSDRLGRQLVRPMRELAGTAHLMSEGDLQARVEVDSMEGVPEEILEVGVAFNTLARQLDRLLQEEREAIADLSHGLRTPLTSLRLQAEKVSDPDERTATLSQVDRLEEAIDNLIEVSRTERSALPGRSALDEVASERVAFWSVLADEQQRELTVVLGAGEAELSIPPSDLVVVIDTLIGNIFEHTEPGVPLRLETGEEMNRLWIQLSDEGSGFSTLNVIDRGASGSGSTGLGLDIVRRIAERTGGSLVLENRDGGGAVVRVWFG